MDIIFTVHRFVYAFLKTRSKNEYSIIQIDRETQKRKILFQHRDSTVFLASYTCESIHYSFDDEFNPNHKSTIFFSVYSDLDYDRVEGAGVPGYFDYYIQADFSIVNPNSDDATFNILGGRKKRKNDSIEKIENFSDVKTEYWLKNYVVND